MIKNQFGRRNLIPYIRAELALKLGGLFKEKALENQRLAATETNTQRRQNIEGTLCQNSDKAFGQSITNNGEYFEKQVEISTHGCQNSDNHVSTGSLVIKSFVKPVEKVAHSPIDRITETLTINNQMVEEPEEDDFEIVQPRQSNFGRAELSLELVKPKQNIYEHSGKVLELEKPSYKRLPEIKPVDTKKELAKIAGISHDTIERVKKIQASAPAEVKQKVSTGEISINQAYTMIKREEKAEKE